VYRSGETDRVGASGARINFSYQIEVEYANAYVGLHQVKIVTYPGYAARVNSDLSEIAGGMWLYEQGMTVGDRKPAHVRHVRDRDAHASAA
jgi:hypothetical protein